MKKIIIGFIVAFGLFITALSQLATATSTHQIIINAINPGYTINGQTNTDEFIELINLTGGPVSLTGLALKYTNSSGNSSIFFEFPEDSVMIGETLLLRLASSPDASDADLVYAKTLAFSAGPLELIRGDDILSSVCWTGKDGCYAKFNSKTPTSLVWNEESGLYEHTEDYYPTYNAETPGYQAPPSVNNDETIQPKCRGLQFSEVLSYYESDQSEQFIEIYNPLDHDVNLTGCQVKYKRKFYKLSGIVGSDNYSARFATDFRLTKNPTSSNEIELIDVDGNKVDEITYYNGQKKATAYAWFGFQNNGEEQWLQTYAPTPGSANNYQKYKTCPEGKVINEATGNCVKATNLNTTLKPCPAGKYRNPLTGRCKSIASSNKSLKPCPDGYERNPETNRCRKIKQNTGAAYPLSATESQAAASSFVALGAVLIIIAIALGYIGFQFRYEIIKLFRKITYLRLRLPRRHRP